MRTRLLMGLLFFTGIALCLTGKISPGAALAMGIALALLGANPFPKASRITAKVLLQVAVVLLGFGMDLRVMARAGLDGAGMAAATIAITFTLGYLLARWMNIHRVTSTLISAGTAICGGSAIAAVGSVIGAAEGEMSVAMGTVFLLNAAALYLFPILGHLLGLTQGQFGTWAGVAIHDVSSVVGAASVYGHKALETATAVKLSRALWIVPVGLIIASLFGEKLTAGVTGSTHDFDPAQPAAKRAKLHVPWFIGAFALASAARTFIPGVPAIAPITGHVAGIAMAITLFLIGAGLSRKALAAVGVRPLLQGVLLWIVISAGSLGLILWAGH